MKFWKDKQLGAVLRRAQDGTARSTRRHDSTTFQLCFPLLPEVISPIGSTITAGEGREGGFLSNVSSRLEWFLSKNGLNIKI